jgi:putative toxin-antitoxin system antitoxin component (TIGR02293 family)
MTSLSTISSVLGGQAQLQARPRSAHDWHELIRRGLPVAAMDAFKQQAMLSDAELAQLIGVSEKTLSRARAGHGKLDPIASDRLYRVVRLVVLAAEVLESTQAALRWLKRAQVGLGSATPLAMMTTDAGSAEVEKLLLRIEHGVYS